MNNKLKISFLNCFSVAQQLVQQAAYATKKEEPSKDSTTLNHVEKLYVSVKMIDGICVELAENFVEIITIMDKDMPSLAPILK